MAQIVEYMQAGVAFGVMAMMFIIFIGFAFIIFALCMECASNVWGTLKHLKNK